MYLNRGLVEIFLLGCGLSVSILIPVAIGYGEITGPMLLAIFAISTASVFFGRDIATKLRMPTGNGFSTAFIVVIGFSALSVLHLIATVAFNLSAKPALLIDFISLTAFHFTLSVGQRCCPAKLKFNYQSISSPYFIDVLALLLISVLTTLWVREAIVAVRVAQETGEFRAWLDFFLHATEVTYLRDYPAFGQQSIYLADLAQGLYHRASYAMSAVFSLVSGQPSLSTATFFWMPVGIILLGLAVYGLGCVLGGRATGFTSVLAIFMLPDASMYGLRNGFFGFHWLLQISPGSGYAMAIVLISLGVYVRGGEKTRLGSMLTIAVLIAMSAAFRIHIAMLATLMFAMLMLMSWHPSKASHVVGVISFLLVIGIGSVVLFERMTMAPHFITGKLQAVEFFDVVHAQTPSTYEGIYKEWSANLSSAWKVLLGYVFLLFASLGAIFPLIFIAAIITRRSEMGWQVDMIPFVLLVAYFAMIIFLPTPAHGDITEYGQRPFLLVYAIFLTMLVSWIVISSKQFLPKAIKTKTIGVPVAVLAVCFGVSLIWHYGKNIQKSSLSWGSNYAITPVSEDMFKASQFIRTNSLPSERILSSDEDPLAIFVALAEKQAFLSRMDIFRKVGGDAAVIFENHAQAHKQLRNISSFVDLIDFGKKNNVQWYLLQINDMPNWPKSLIDKSVYHSGHLFVYDLRDPGKHAESN